MDSSNTKRSRVVLTAVLGGFAAAALLATVTLAPRQAAATPAYAGQTKKACGFCHVNPAGGGPRTPAGDKFQQNGHKL
jgi:cytochrome c553